MSGERLPTDLWVMAHVRQCAAKGIPATIVRKGAVASGTVMVKIFARNGVRLFNQSRDMDGNLGWLDLLGGLKPEPEADAAIARALSRDPDLWVVEVEDREGRAAEGAGGHPLLPPL
jgi:hypothetical protein